MHLSRQMAAFLRAGLPILDAVHSIGAEAENSSVRRMMNDIEDGLRGGDRFSDCLDRHPKVFPDFYRGIVRSAELTGELDTVLALRLAHYLERDLERPAQDQVRPSIYPAAVAWGCRLSPSRFLRCTSYRSSRRSSPASTPNCRCRRGCCCTSPISCRAGGGPSSRASALVVAPHGSSVSPSDGRGRTAIGRGPTLLLAIPVLGETIQYALVERFCRVLASMVQAGVATCPKKRCNVATEASLKNLAFTSEVSFPTVSVTEAMLEGQGLATPLGTVWTVSIRTATQMLRVGEDTGTLDAQLEVTSEYYETELNYKIAKVTGLFRADRHRDHGRDRRLRRDRSDLGDVRHLPSGEGLTIAAAAIPGAEANRARRSSSS